MTTDRTRKLARRLAGCALAFALFACGDSGGPADAGEAADHTACDTWVQLANDKGCNASACRLVPGCEPNS